MHSRTAGRLPLLLEKDGMAQCLETFFAIGGKNRAIEAAVECTGMI
jgi:hypothetical protein